MNEKKRIYTIGHSNRTLEDFISILKSFNIELLVDIRMFPGSKKYPHFNKPELERSLAKENIRYLHLIDLGGRRKANKDSKNTAWRHPAFRAYADYMETENFQHGISKLVEAGLKYNTAYMCSEAVWWSCHRSLVSDYLKSIGWEVLHIMDVGKAKEHPYTSAARIIDGKLSYDTPL